MPRERVGGEIDGWDRGSSSHYGFQTRKCFRALLQLLNRPRSPSHLISPSLRLSVSHTHTHTTKHIFCGFIIGWIDKSVVILLLAMSISIKHQRKGWLKFFCSWSSYKISQWQDKIGVFVSIVSTKIPFKGTGKEYIGDDINEIASAVKVSRICFYYFLYSSRLLVFLTGQNPPVCHPAVLHPA